MAVIVNHNISALNAANNLTQTYSRLAKSVSRLSSGLRIVSAEDDAAGLAVRELMRSDIRVMEQGVRNAQDAINMLMTADGAMGVIDEKLIRMKELAEQAATGTYTTAQREIMNDEFNAMADEITRIANATEFNGIKLLDGSLSALHGGQGAKIHFGTGNSSAEDYYYVNLGDMRSSNLLGAGEGANYNLINETEFASADTALNDAGFFGFYYNNDGTDGAATDTATLADVYGLYEITSDMTLNDVADMINEGNAARATITFDTGSNVVGSGSIVAVDGVQYEFVSQASDVTAGNIGVVMGAGSAWAGSAAASALMTAINAYGGTIWAQMSGATQYEFTVYGKANVANNTVKVSADVNFGSVTTGVGSSFELSSGAYLNGGGSSWITATVEARTNATGSTVYQLRLVAEDASTSGGTDASYYIQAINMSTADYFGGLASTNWTTNFHKDSTDDDWSIAASTSGIGLDISTQSGAQAALSALDEAIIAKDQARAEAGSMVNRLENTVTALTIQAENLQASESAISDADIAAEMSEFTRNLILAQSGVAMLAQANSLSNLALSLLG